MFLTEVIDTTSSDFIIYMPVSQNCEKNEINGFFGTEVRGVWNLPCARASLLAPSLPCFFLGPSLTRALSYHDEFFWCPTADPKLSSFRRASRALPCHDIPRVCCRQQHVRTTFFPQSRRGHKYQALWVYDTKPVSKPKDLGTSVSGYFSFLDTFETLVPNLYFCRSALHWMIVR